MITISETRDAGLIASLNEEVQNLHAEDHPNLFKPYDEVSISAALSSLLQDENCRAYVAYKDATPAGYALLFIREVKETAFQYRSRTLYLDQLAVLSPFRNAGIGNLLLQQAEILAKELSIDRMELDHWTSNTAAAQYFRKKGYALYKERLYKLV